MWQAMTDRRGPDESPLTLRAERGLDGEPNYPRMGALVCAVGIGGWTYTGKVVSLNTIDKTFTIQPVARNALSERAGIPSQAEAARTPRKGEYRIMPDAAQFRKAG